MGFDFEPSGDGAVTNPLTSDNAPDEGYAVRKLWAAVLLQAINDLSRDKLHDSAYEFLMSSDSDFAWHVLGIDPIKARKKITDRVLDKSKPVLTDDEAASGDTYPCEPAALPVDSPESPQPSL